MSEIKFDYLIIHTGYEERLLDKSYTIELKKYTTDKMIPIFIKNYDKYHIFDTDLYNKIIKYDKYFKQSKYICIKCDISDHVKRFMTKLDYCAWFTILDYTFINDNGITIAILDYDAESG